MSNPIEGQEVTVICGGSVSHWASWTPGLDESVIRIMDAIDALSDLERAKDELKAAGITIEGYAQPLPIFKPVFEMPPSKTRRYAQRLGQALSELARTRPDLPMPERQALAKKAALR